MEFKGSGFKYFFNNESKTREEILSLINDNTTVSIKGLDVFYNSPKTNKTEEFLKEAEQYQENNGGRVETEFLVDEITTGFSFYPKESKIFTYNPKYLNDKNLNLEEVTKIITEERKGTYSFLRNCNKVEGINEGVKDTEGKLDYSEINLEILDLMASRFTVNKHKYPKGNMKKPLDKDSLVWAAFRHIRKMLQPIENDPESFKEHLTAVLCNMSMILDQENLK